MTKIRFPKIGETVRIIPEKEYRIMSPPRRPRGEKPATTIRYLKRQIANLQTACTSHRNAAEDRAKVIAGYDVQLSEASETERVLRRRVSDQAERIGELSANLRLKSERLAFLEGYYEKSQETQPPRPIYATRASIIGDQPETNAGSGSGNSSDLSAGRQRSQNARVNQGQAGIGARLGDPVWRQRAHDIPYPEGRAMEHVEIK